MPGLRTQLGWFWFGVGSTVISTRVVVHGVCASAIAAVTGQPNEEDVMYLIVVAAQDHTSTMCLGVKPCLFGFAACT